MDLMRTLASVVVIALAVTVMIGCGGADPGGDEAPLTLTLDVEGMTCGSCEAAIVRTVGQIDGVEMVESHHETGQTTVLYRPNSVSREMIVDTIEDLGYTVVTPEG